MTHYVSVISIAMCDKRESPPAIGLSYWVHICNLLSYQREQKCTDLNVLCNLKIINVEIADLVSAIDTHFNHIE